MHVTHIIPRIDPAYGGPATALIGLATAQVRAGIDVRVIACWFDQPPTTNEQTLRDTGVDLHMVGPTHGKFHRHPDIQRVIASQLPTTQIVHIHGLWEEVQHQASRHARKLGKPYIFRPCGMLDPWSLKQSALVKRFYMAWRLRRNLQHAAGLHFTAELEHELTAPLRLKAPPMIVPNGIDLQEFAQLPEKGYLRQRFALPQDRPLLLFLSRIHHKKGLDLLIPTLAQLQSTDACLVVVGPGEADYINSLRQLAQTHKVADRVIFSKPLFGPDRIAAFLDADLFVLPSHQENFGIVVVEALATGTPVVISDQVNIHREISAAGVGGVSPLNANALAATLDHWLADRARLRDVAPRCRNFALTHYNWNDIAVRWRDIYDRLA